MMKQALSILMLAVSSLINQGGHAQALKVGLIGLRRSAVLVDASMGGPLIVNPIDKNFSYGINVGYETGANGVELAISNFPYRANLHFKDFFGEVVNPSNITLVTASYRRKIFDFTSLKLRLYGAVGVGVGKYRYKPIITSGDGTVNVNGTEIYRGRLDNFSNYDRSSVLIPALKLEIEKNLFSHAVVALFGSYQFKNHFGSGNPLEEGSYRYTYYGARATGRLAEYGQGYCLGIGVKYEIDFSKP
jgi:hypothetical protein